MKLSSLFIKNYVVHGVVFILFALFSIYLMIAYNFMEISPVKWGNTARVLAVVFFLTFVLPIITTLIESLTSKTETYEQ
jgi:uncharacterized membrane protein YjfL (UPF0719 family)